MKTVAGLGEVAVELAGAPLRPEDAECLGELSVRQVLSLPAQCELLFRGIPDEFGDRAALLAGLSLTVSGETGAIFEGEVTAIEHAYTPDGGRELRLRAYDPLHRLRKRQPVEIRNDVDAGELCRQFAQDLGLSAEISESGPRWPRLAQWYQTNFELLVEISRRAGLFFTVGNGALRLFTLEGIGDEIGLTLGDDLLEASFEVNGDRAWPEVGATGWDPATGARFEATAGSARSGRSADSAISTTEVGGEGKRLVVNAPVPAAEHVDAEAQGLLDCATANAVTVRGVASGAAGLYPGCRVKLTRMHPRVAGTYVIAEVVHTLDPERGLLSEFSSEIPASPRSRVVTLVAPGVVDRVDDPDNQGRVTVKLPGYQQIETGWMRVLLPGAGAAKGFVALPDEGDEVLVLMPDGDPAAGIVLGALFGTSDVPDTGIVDRRVRRQSWRSGRGHYVEIDDDLKQITVQHANGSMVRLGEERLSIRSVTDLEIIAPGRTITITAGAVDFRKG